MTSTHRLEFFNAHIVAAMQELRFRAGYQCSIVRRMCVTTALAHLRHAFGLANALQDGARKALCMRLMNWLRTDLRRAS